jgi:phage FluMu protein Com
MKTKTRTPIGVYRSPDGTTMKETRCVNPLCNKFICYEAVEIGIIQHPCRKCKSVTQVSVLPGDDDTPPEKMQEVRCGKCGRYLYSEALIKGSVKTKCRGCGEWNTLTISDDEITPKVEE